MKWCGSRKDHLQRLRADRQAETNAGCQIVAPGSGGKHDALGLYLTTLSAHAYDPFAPSQEGRSCGSVPVGCAVTLGSGCEGARSEHWIGLAVAGAVAASHDPIMQSWYKHMHLLAIHQSHVGKAKFMLT